MVERKLGALFHFTVIDTSKYRSPRSERSDLKVFVLIKTTTNETSATDGSGLVKLSAFSSRVRNKSGTRAETKKFL